jgi:hypothetical protein
MDEFERSGSVGGAMESVFVAPRRQRQDAKIILTNMPSGILQGARGEEIINVNAKEPHLEDVIMRHLTAIVSGFIEGRYTLSTWSGADKASAFVDLSSVLVDCTANETGGPSIFNILDKYTPAGFLEDLAMQMSSMYRVDASVVEGSKTGLLLRRQS